MAGFIGYYKTSHSEEQRTKMMERIRHRGPDYSLTLDDGDLHLGFLGLDLGYRYDHREIHQDENCDVMIVGYLSNEDEIFQKAGLSKDADPSPAQGIASLYEKKGMDLANDLRGAYLIVLFDRKTERLYLIRDILGLQPLYYYPTEQGLIFVSEAKALLDHPDFHKVFNPDALRPYLVFQGTSTKESFFKGAYLSEGGMIISYDHGTISEKRYWEFSFEEKEGSLEEQADRINEAIQASIKRWDKFDTESGVFLSGGVDSSYFAGSVKPKKTFTVGYTDREFSEIDIAKDLSGQIGATNYNRVITAEDMFREIGNIEYMLDEPLANFSAVAIYFLSELAQGQIKLALGGEGSDEFFGGYFEYKTPKAVENVQWIPQGIRSAFGHWAARQTRDFKGKNFLMKAGLPVEERYIGQLYEFHEEEANAVLKPEFQKGPTVRDITEPVYARCKGMTDLRKKQFLDFHLWMNNIINLKGDRMTMAHSVQLVAPIATQEVYEVARTIPERYLVDEEKDKIAFRFAAQKFLPEAWAKRKKKGFPVPVRIWLQDEKNAKIVFDKVTGELSKKFFNQEEIQKLIEIHKKGTWPAYKKLMTLYFFLVWYEEYFVKR